MLQLTARRSRETSLTAGERGALTVVLPAIAAVGRLTTHAGNKVVINGAGAYRTNHFLNHCRIGIVEKLHSPRFSQPQQLKDLQRLLDEVGRVLKFWPNIGLAEYQFAFVQFYRHIVRPAKSRYPEYEVLDVAGQ